MTTLQTRIEPARKTAESEYPDAEKITPWFYCGDVGVWVWRVWDSVLEGRSFLLTGEEL